MEQRPMNQPKYELPKRPEPPKTNDKSLFGGKSQASRYEIEKKLKNELRADASRYGLYSSHANEIGKILPPDGTLEPYHIERVIRDQEQQLHKMMEDSKGSHDYEKQRVKRGLIDFLKSKLHQ
jgi:hypothetical protein